MTTRWLIITKTIVTGEVVVVIFDKTLKYFETTPTCYSRSILQLTTNLPIVHLFPCLTHNSRESQQLSSATNHGIDWKCERGVVTSS